MQSPEKPYSLAIGGGGGLFSRGGLGGGWGAKAKLSHDHRTQFVFCHQTFTLWREVMTHMYKLWSVTRITRSHIWSHAVTRSDT